MHNQTDQMERPMRAGHAEKLASRVGNGGNARAGESPAASTISRDDRLVWDTPTGATLFATRTLHMDGEEDRAPVFTKGRAYRVVSMHPIACPAFVKVIDDQGTEHILEGEHIRAWFSRVSPNAALSRCRPGQSDEPK